MNDNTHQEFSIPPALIEKWVGLRSDQKVEIPLSRGDLDHLFFAVNNLAKSIGKLQSCLVLYSQGNLEEANTAMQESQKLVVRGDNEMRMFMNALMAGARPAGGTHGNS
jgi:hypothetical protein